MDPLRWKEPGDAAFGASELVHLSQGRQCTAESPSPCAQRVSEAAAWKTREKGRRRVRLILLSQGKEADMAFSHSLIFYGST